MLSPASHRVCCLAVMAPALTKADRRTDCLPVVLSDPFCVSETVANINRKDKIPELLVNKPPASRVAHLLAKRKPSMHRIWFRTFNLKNHSEQGDKSRFSTHDLRKTLLGSKVKLIASENKGKSWHGAHATIAVADKVRLKYIMNKSNGSLHRNMGLAKANTTLGLHNIRKMNRFSHERDNNSPSSLAQESGESSPDLPDSTKSELDTVFPILRIVQPLTELPNDIAPSSDDLCKCSQVKSDLLLTNDELEGSIKNPDSALEVLNDCYTSTPLNSDITASESQCELPVTLTETSSSFTEIKCDDSVEVTTQLLNSDQNLHLKSIASLPEVSSDCPVLNSSNAISKSETNSQISSSTTPASEITEVDCEQSLSHFNSCISLPSEPCTNTSVPIDCEEMDVPAPSPDPFQSPLSPRHDSDIETASANYSFSSSSTLSADDDYISPLGSPSHDFTDSVFVTFPDSFLASGSDKRTPTEIIETPMFPSTSSLHHHNSYFEDSGQEDDMLADQCCPFTRRDLSSLRKSFRDLEGKMSTSLRKVEDIMNKCMLDHIRQEVRTLVQCLQEKLSIQNRQTRSFSHLKSTRDEGDLKVELPRHEEIQTMSTAALVNLVQRLGSTSLSNLPVYKADTELQVTGDVLPETFPDEDFLDVKNTSQVLLKNLKNLLKSSDPDLTESSDEDESDIEMEEVLNDFNQKRALLKFMKQRAALASRSTWLIARIHELENQLRTIGGIYKKLTLSIKDVSFEDRITSQCTDKSKVLAKPVNGLLDRSNGMECKLFRSEDSCSRTRALQTSAFSKRKVLVTTGLHTISSRLNKLSTVGCICNSLKEAMPCVLCTGRYSCTQTVDPDTLPLLDRVAVLDPNFHPILSFEKDIPLLLHFENIFKKNESQYQIVPQFSSSIDKCHRRLRLESKPKHFVDARSRSRKISRYARSLLSAKYRNKKHFRKHKLVFGKWRRFQNKSSFHTKDRFRRLSVASSGSSRDSPIPSPFSGWEDGYDSKRKRDDNQFDIDDVIIPYSNKRGRLVKFEFKDIEIPSWKVKLLPNLENIAGLDLELEEEPFETAYVKRHDKYEVEERKILRHGGNPLNFFNTWQKRSDRMQNPYSRMDSSGANTPVLMCDPDYVFQNQSSPINFSPAGSPPPASCCTSDDSQGGTRKKFNSGGKKSEECAGTSVSVDITPYESRCFPLPDEFYESLLLENEQYYSREEETMGYPVSPATTISTSTIDDDDDDITDPEWTVVKKESGADLVLKFAKR